MSRLNLIRSGDATDPWEATDRSSGGGVAFLVTWKTFEKLLKGDSLSSMKPNEFVTRFEVGTDGVTVFVETM